MKKLSTTFLAVATFFIATAVPAFAQEGSFMVRVRALSMQVDNGNSPDVAAAKISINNKIFPEIDFVYGITKNISAELVLTYPQKHDVKLNGANIGSVKHLPPTLTLQYQFASGSTVNPYVGAGVNYTRFMSVNLPTGITLDKSSVGGALQAGIDFEIAKNTYLNLDYKYVKIGTDVNVGAVKLTKLAIDPSLISVGIGWKF